MLVHVEQRGTRWRVVESRGAVVKMPNGSPRDGGGHRTRGQAEQQAQAINSRRMK